MSLTGKNTLSIRRQDVAEQKSIALGIRKLTFAHKATAGDTGINLSSLVNPSEMSSVGFVNPPVTDMLAANLLFNRRNLTLISSVRGVLMDYLSYDIRTSSRINFSNFTALQDEIFVGIIDPLPKTELKAVDAQPIVVSGELAVGVTDFNVGVPFETNKFPSQQVGAVLVYRNGVQQFRNPNNSTTGGNYQEVSSGAALGTLIRFNNAPVSQSDSILVVSVGLLAERPDGSMMAVIENLAGQIDQMIPTLADLAGVDESEFQSAPNNVDLKQFGDQVIDHEARLDELEAEARGVTAYRASLPIASPATPFIFNSVFSGNAYGEYNTSTGIFTCMKAGRYQVSSQIQIGHTGSSGQYINIALYKNSVQQLHQTTRVVTGTSTWVAAYSPMQITLSVGDQIFIGQESNNITGIAAVSDTSWLSISLLRN